jgi:hypothetical protein
MAPNEKVLFHETLGLRSKTWGESPFFDRDSPVFEENMKERRSMYEHFPKMSILRFCHERAQIKRWGAVRHVIVSGISMRVFFICIFSLKKWFSENVTCFDLEGDFGCFRRDFCEFVRIVAWNRDGKCC